LKEYRIIIIIIIIVIIIIIIIIITNNLSQAMVFLLQLGDDGHLSLLRVVCR